MITLDTQNMMFQATEQKGILQIQMPTRLSILESDSFRQFFQESLFKHKHISQIILDFERTMLIDSCGIGAFFSNLKYAQTREVQLISKNVGPQVMMLFSLTGLDQILTIEPKINELR